MLACIQSPCSWHNKCVHRQPSGSCTNYILVGGGEDEMLLYILSMAIAFLSRRQGPSMAGFQYSVLNKLSASCKDSDIPHLGMGIRW